MEKTLESDKGPPPKKKSETMVLDAGSYMLSENQNNCSDRPPLFEGVEEQLAVVSLRNSSLRCPVHVAAH